MKDLPRYPIPSQPKCGTKRRLAGDADSIVSSGGPDIALKYPNVRTLVNTIGDGNCMFRALSCIITGSQTQYNEIRNAIVTHMQLNSDLFMTSGCVGINANYDSVDEYLFDTLMDTDGARGTSVEMFALAHLLSTRIISYSWRSHTWQLHSPSHVDPSLRIYETDSDCAMFLYHTGNHFKVFRSIIS